MQEGPIGDMILLDYYNKRTGKVEPMVDADVDLQCINHGRELPISDVHGNLQSNSISSEVITMSYSGLKLTYYKDDMGIMRIARENNGILQEIETESLSEIEYEKQLEQSKTKLDKLNVISKKRTPEEIKKMKMEEIHYMSPQEAIYCINQLDSAEDRFDFVLGLPISDKEYDSIRDLVALDAQQELQSVNPFSPEYQEKAENVRAMRILLMKHMSQEWKQEHEDELKAEFPDWVLSKSNLRWDGKLYGKPKKQMDMPEEYDSLDEMDPPGDDDPLAYDDPLAQSESREETKRLNISEDTLKGYATDYMATKRYLDTRTDLSKGERDDWLEGEMYDSFLDMIAIKEEGLARSDEDIKILYEQYGKQFRDMVEGKMNEINENARNVRADLFVNSKDVSLDEKQNIEMYEMRENERQEQENQEMMESRRGIR